MQDWPKENSSSPRIQQDFRSLSSPTAAARKKRKLQNPALLFARLPVALGQLVLEAINGRTGFRTFFPMGNFDEIAAWPKVDFQNKNQRGIAKPPLATNGRTKSFLPLAISPSKERRARPPPFVPLACQISGAFLLCGKLNKVLEFNISKQFAGRTSRTCSAWRAACPR